LRGHPVKNLSQYIQDASRGGTVFSLLATHLNFTVVSICPFPVRHTFEDGLQTISKGEHMAQKIFVNLPVRDLRKSMDFFGKCWNTPCRDFDSGG